MALKALMLRRSIDQKKQQLDALREKDADFQTRERDLETSINAVSYTHLTGKPLAASGV